MHFHRVPRGLSNHRDKGAALPTIADSLATCFVNSFPRPTLEAWRQYISCCFHDSEGTALSHAATTICPIPRLAETHILLIMDSAQLTFELSDRHQRSRIWLGWWDATQQHLLDQGCEPGVSRHAPMSIDAKCRRENLRECQ
jgi:hypothetical protein